MLVRNAGKIESNVFVNILGNVLRFYRRVFLRMTYSSTIHFCMFLQKRDRAIFDSDTIEPPPHKRPKTSDRPADDKPPKPDVKTPKSHADPTRHKKPDGDAPSDRSASAKHRDDKKRRDQSNSVEAFPALAAEKEKKKKRSFESAREERTKERKSSEADASRPARLGFVIPKKRPLEYAVNLERLRQE